jgi:hypothetical protein
LSMVICKCVDFIVAVRVGFEPYTPFMAF